MVMGTRAHQLAMYAVYGAPIQMVSDSPAAYKNQPAFDFIKAVPATWDETRVLNGVPGEYVTMARRHGKDWYLGSMTNWTPRSLDLPLTFLSEKSYTAEIYQDAKDAAPVAEKRFDFETDRESLDAPEGRSRSRRRIRRAPGSSSALRKAMQARAPSLVQRSQVAMPDERGARNYTLVLPLNSAEKRGAPQVLIASREPNRIMASKLERPSRTK